MFQYNISALGRAASVDLIVGFYLAKLLVASGIDETKLNQHFETIEVFFPLTVNGAVPPASIRHELVQRFKVVIWWLFLMWWRVSVCLNCDKLLLSYLSQEKHRCLIRFQNVFCEERP